jgi:hypothetical protein
MRGRDDIMAALSRLAAQRADLDHAEAELIDSARAMGVGWAQIAAALGLRSRQAAEQRRARLAGIAGRQRIVDNAVVRDLRAAVRAALDAFGEEWDALAPQALLARMSLEAAVDAAAGAMFALCAHALSDLDAFTVPDRWARQNGALSRLRTAFDAALKAAAQD